MRGASRSSFASLRERLEGAVTGAAEANILGSELFAVVGLLDREHVLRRALSDPGKPAAEKAALARMLLHGKVSPAAAELVATAGESHWASSTDMAAAMEQLAIEAFVRSADFEGKLDDLEDDLFRFGRVVAGEPRLRAALDNSSLPAENKRNLLNALLGGKVSGVAVTLISQMVTHPRGRSLPVALDLCADIAAQHRQRLIAVVRTAMTLTEAQRGRLAAALAAAYGHEVYLNVVVDPAVVGGISIQIGDELIDGTVATRLAEVRRRLAA
jgi:F-type H+-transporting ATPase subunit delta